jgi:hypothetical protein
MPVDLRQTPFARALGPNVTRTVTDRESLTPS